MISIATILLFFLYLWGFGFTATYFVKQSENFLERNLINIGIGLGIFPILSIILNFFRIPLDWKIFLFLSISFPIYILIKKIKNKTFKFNLSKIKLTKSNLIIFLVFLIFLFSFYMYAKGSFAYPYLENEDPWGHSVGIDYVSIEKTAYDPIFENDEIDQVLSYMDPYPPAYDILLGILHQTSPDLIWTIKFFNALIISLGLLFFYFFVNIFVKNKNKALFATFILAAVPSYLSHFIWAHSLVITLFFPTMYAFEKIKVDKKWVIVSAILVASIWVSQNLSQPIKITTMILIYLIVISITNKKIFYKGFTALFGGMVLSQFWWSYMVKKYTFKGFVDVWQGQKTTESITSSSSTIIDRISSLIGTITNPGGSGSRAYTFNDFFVAKTGNMINNPIGIGVMISIITLIGLIYLLWKYKSSIVNKKNTWACVTLFWLIFTFWGVNGQTFPISIARGPFRVWMLLAIPLSIVATEGAFFLKNMFKQKSIKSLIIIGIIIGVIFTSGVHKFNHNTSIWPTSSAFNSPQEAFEYAAWFETIPDETKVFMFTTREKIIIGLGKQSCNWCEDEINFRNNMINNSVEEIHLFLKERDYEYLLLSIKNDYKYFKRTVGEENAEEILIERYNQIINSGLFETVYQKEGVFIALKLR